MFNWLRFNLNTTVNNVLKIPTNLFKDCEFFIRRNQRSLIKKINHLKRKENVIITFLHSQILSKSVSQVSVLTLSLVVILMSTGVASSSLDMSIVLWRFSNSVKMIFRIQKYALNLTKQSHNEYDYYLVYRDDRLARYRRARHFTRWRIW